MVNGGGDLVTRDGYIGYYSSDPVTATIGGSGSYWNADGWDVTVGRGGKGSLTIENGGDVLCEYATVGSYNLASDAATATITGSGSQWSVTRDFKVGDGSGTGGGYGTLNVLSSGYADVEGTMTVDRNATLYVNGGRIAIGDDASTPANNHVLIDGCTAALRVYGRAKIGTASTPCVGVLYLAGDHHLDIIDGSVYTVADLYVGYDSCGTMTVSAGGQVSTSNGWVGHHSPSATSTATVTGSNSSWNTRGGTLRVGFNGKGMLNVEDGGHVISGDAYIGVTPRAPATSTSSTQATWMSSRAWT